MKLGVTCIYIYVYTYIYIHTHIHFFGNGGTLSWQRKEIFRRQWHIAGLLSVPPRRGRREKRTQWLWYALKQKENDNT